MSIFEAPFNTFIVHPLINILALLYDVLFHDFGLAIVVLTVALRLVLYPLFRTQMRSQRAMQEIQPALAELKKKHKDDRQRFAEEQMKLYRERGVNPAGGCLPLLLQFPILIGLYSSLNQMGCGLGPPPNCPGLSFDQFEAIRYPFVANPIPPGGSALDATAHWLPWITNGLAHPGGDPLHILPILAGVTQLIASLMTLPTKTAQTDDPMQRSMQSMVYYFPLFTIFIAWNLPAGLAVYWVTTTLFSIAQQWSVSGWGKLQVYLPLLAKIPSPSATQIRREEEDTKREIEADLRVGAAGATVAANGGQSKERQKRRKKRR